MQKNSAEGNLTGWNRVNPVRKYQLDIIVTLWHCVLHSFLLYHFF